MIISNDTGNILPPGGNGGAAAPANRPLLALFLLLLPALLLVPTSFSQPAEEDIPPIRPLRTGGLKAEVAALIMSGQEGGAIPMEVLVLPLQGGGEGGGKARVPLVVEIAGGGLVGTHLGGPFRFEIYAYAISEDGGLQGSLLQTFEVDLERLDPPPEKGGVKFSGEMELAPGEYSLRVLVRRSGTQDVGVRVIPLEIGGADDTPRLLAPLLAEAEGAWLELNEVRGRNALARERLDFLSQVPAAKAVIPPGKEIPFRLLAFHLESVGSALVMEFEDQSGRRLAEAEAQVSSYSLPTEQGYRVLQGTFRSDGLVNGEYRLKAVLNVNEERVESRSVPVMVVDPAVASRPDAESATVRIWSQVTPEVLMANQIMESVPAEEEGRGNRRRRKKQIDHRPILADYEKVLGLLAEGKEGQARAKLFRLSIDVIKQDGSEGLQVLSQVQILNANRIAEARPEALVPLALLHHDLYRDALRRRVSMLSTHARATSLGIVELYLDHSKLASAKGLAADFFASFGGALLEAELFRFSERLFRRALELEDAHPMSLLGLGISYEKLGDYEGSLGFLDELVEAHPDAHQGHLRLAVNQVRTQRKRPAFRHLKEGLKSSEPWVRSLAYQELARLHMDSDELEEAENVLREGVEALPGEDKLYVLLAFVLDAQQRSEETMRVLAEMAAKTDRREESARHLYTKGSEQIVDNLRRKLKRQAEVREEDLREALPTEKTP